MTSDAPQRMACALGRELDPASAADGPPRMTMLRAIVGAHEDAVRACDDDELDASARLRRALHEAVAAVRRRPA